MNQMNQMGQMGYQREMLAFDEKIALAELEVAKAEERVKELKFHKIRFAVDSMNAHMKASQQAQQPQPQPPQQEGPAGGPEGK